jgi:hypothetical protein
MGNVRKMGTLGGGLRWEERTGKTSKGISKAKVWFAIVAKESMRLEKGQSKFNQITINISTALNALGVGKPISYNLQTIYKDWRAK